MKEIVKKGDKDGLLRVLKACIDNGDTEAAHSDADDALIQFIGDADIRAAYEEVSKWYA